MEYLYAALLLHESGTEINETNLTDVLEAAHVDVRASQAKALVAALEDEDLDNLVAETATESPSTSNETDSGSESAEDASDVEMDPDGSFADEFDNEEVDDEVEDLDEGMSDLF